MRSISATRSSSSARGSACSSTRATSTSSCATNAGRQRQGSGEKTCRHHRTISNAGCEHGRRVIRYDGERRRPPTREETMALNIDTSFPRRVTEQAIEVIPTGRPLAAEVTGVDLRELDAAAFARVIEAWHDHSVLLF